MRDLTQHFTARADDSHAAPVNILRREAVSLQPSCLCQALVRFLAYHRIKPHAPPLVRAPVNSFEFHPCEHTPQAVHLTRCYGTDPQRTNTQCTSFTAWTTRVSNPVRSPRFRASASVNGQELAFASGVLPDLYRFHPYTRNSSSPSITLVTQFPAHLLG